MRTQVYIPAPEDWNAHKHRDFIDDFSVKLAQSQHRILALALRNTSRELAEKLEATDVGPLFRVSYPRNRVTEIQVQITTSHNETLEQLIRADGRQMLDEVSRSFLGKCVDWLAMKCLGPEDFKKANEESQEEFIQGQVKKNITRWENELHSAFLTIMGQELRPQFDVFRAELHHDGLVAYIPLSQILDDQNQAPTPETPRSSPKM